MQILGYFKIIDHFVNIFIINKLLEHSQIAIHSISFPRDYHLKYLNSLAQVFIDIKQLVSNAKTKTIGWNLMNIFFYSFTHMA